jgi:hypothetical protein
MPALCLFVLELASLFGLTEGQRKYDLHRTAASSEAKNNVLHNSLEHIPNN